MYMYTYLIVKYVPSKVKYIKPIHFTDFLSDIITNRIYFSYLAIKVIKILSVNKK